MNLDRTRCIGERKIKSEDVYSGAMIVVVVVEHKETIISNFEF